MKLLFNYLPFSMKESSDPVARSNKKAKGTANNSIIKLKSSPTKLSGNSGNIKCSNGTSPASKSSKSSPIDKIKKKKNKNKIVKEPVVGLNKKSTKRKIENNSADSNSNSSGSSTNLSPRKKNLKKKGNNKTSPELRPRRRASQTYFFKYQLARNPLKAEEEDLKLALLASLQQCGNSKINSNADINKLNTTTTTSSSDRSSQSNQAAQKQKNQSQNNNSNNTSHHQHTNLNHNKQPQTEAALATRAPPTKYDEEYLKRYRPETEDFLTFICFRITAPNHNQTKSIIESTANNVDGTNDTNNYSTNNNNTDTKSNEKSTSNDSQNHHKRSSSPCKSVNNVSNSPNHFSPSNRRRPTRQSPRLASSNRRISEFDNSNAAYDNFINYEEDVKRASIALEDMAQEINGKDDLQNNRVSQSSSEQQVIAKLSPYKNNKHLVKGLMTREFAGAFADEEIIFESISNHKL